MFPKPIIAAFFRPVLAALCVMVVVACGSHTTREPAHGDSGGAQDGLGQETAGTGTDLGRIGPFDLKPDPPRPDVPDIQPELDASGGPETPDVLEVGFDLLDVSDSGPDLVDVQEGEVGPQLCDSDQWCIDKYGPGVYCRGETGQCLPGEPVDYAWCDENEACGGAGLCHVWSPSGGRCAPACEHDDLCIALSPNLLCDTDTSLCYEAEPLRCSLNRECGWMGPDYACNVKAKCLILPTPDEGCDSKEDCPVEPEVTICHDSIDPGACAPPCADDLGCEALGPGLECDTGNGKCE